MYKEEMDKLVTVKVHTSYMDFPQHDRKYIEAIHVVEGSITTVIDGKKEVIDKGELIFVNRHSCQEVRAEDENDIVVCARIQPEFFEQIRNRAGVENIPAEIMERVLIEDSEKGEFLHFKAGDMESIQNRLEALILKLKEEKRYQVRTDQKELEMVFLFLLNKMQNAKMRRIDRYGNMVVMFALDYIEHNYQNGTLTELCRNLNLPIHTLSRLIKRITGYNFKELLQRKRLFKAVILLCDTALTVNDIVQAVGYENNSYFYSVFKDRYNTTPRDFRFRYCRNKLIRV